MSIDKANLLVDIDSFRWDNLAIDREQAMDDLVVAFGLIIEQADIIFSHPKCYDYYLSWGYFHEILTFDEEEKKIFIPWLTDDHQQTLINIWSRSTTEELASTLDKLDEEFPGANNGLLGCSTGVSMNRFVYNELTWKNLHQDFVKANPSIKAAHFEYFKKFFIPGLTAHPNQINTMIQREQVHSIFERLDTPTYIDDQNTLHREQIQMHFKDINRSALNIDGTWKHGGFEIPVDACQQLEEWGFLLPD